MSTVKMAVIQNGDCENPLYAHRYLYIFFFLAVSRDVWMQFIEIKMYFRTYITEIREMQPWHPRQFFSIRYLKQPPP